MRNTNNIAPTIPICQHAHRQLRTGVQDASRRTRGGGPAPGERADAFALWRRQKTDRGLRSAVPVWHGARRTRCAIRAVDSGGNHNDANWDAHGDLKANHDLHAGETDKPIAGLLKDLRQRGLLDETLVVWGGEFGRQPTAEYEKGTGRDHNAYGFTMWMAGGGIKGGVTYGKTDELGSAAVENRLQVKQLHATILHQLGLDPNRLSYFYNGLDQKLVGVEGAAPIMEIIA